MFCDVIGMDPVLVKSVLIPVGLGCLVSSTTRQETQSPWYRSLKKPGWAPPDWLFGPVWLALYVMMGVAFWRILRAGGDRNAVTLYAVQLALNIAWSVLFFHGKSLTWALADIVALLSVLVVTTATFYQIDPTAGYLMMPYLAWVIFATSLNGALYLENP